MWRNFRYQYMTALEKSEIRPHLEEFQIFPYNRCGVWRNSTFLHITDVKKSESYPVFCCKIYFVAIYAFLLLQNSLWRDLRALVRRKIEPKIG